MARRTPTHRKQDMTKKLKSALDAAIMGYIRKFEKIHGVDFEYAVSDDLTGVLCFGDNYFNLSDIVYDIDNKLAVRLIYQWQDDSTANFGSGKYINLQSYAKGLRYE
jgi:hypothetical protein